MENINDLAQRLSEEYYFILEGGSYKHNTWQREEGRFDPDTIIYLLEAVDYDEFRATRVLDMIVENLGHFTAQMSKISGQKEAVTKGVLMIADYLRENPDASPEDISERFIEKPQEEQARRKEYPFAVLYHPANLRHLSDTYDGEDEPDFF